MNTNNLKEISPNLRLLEDGLYMFAEGEYVRTPRGTGFIVGPLEPLDPQGWGYCLVQLDGHEDEGPTLFSCSTKNSDQNAISIE